ncbi:Beta-1 adrenergic receptor [Holothuria leucospilota]|uniref:Beta-1 adrenergic receptor n=1 Tax=Holothuria leucospilota TaxID=206669 RepID=A0A9Q1CG82_HOLLE|nr:Beta-1 adrenergic receptor [Holothuria leucospilota]
MDLANGNDTDYILVDVPVSLQVIYFILGIAILVTNLIVIIAFLLDRDIRSVPTNIFIFNLSISDFLMGTDLIFHFSWSNESGLIVAPLYGTLWCQLNTAIYYQALLVSVWTVVVISWDRLQMVSNPFKYRQRTVRRAVWIVITLWSILLLYVCFNLFVLPMFYDDPIDQVYCIETDLPNDYVLESWWTDFLLPFVILVVINVRVVTQLRKATIEKYDTQMKEMYGTDASSNQNDRTSSKNYDITSNSDGNENTSEFKMIGEETTLSTTLKLPELRIQKAVRLELGKIQRTTKILEIFVGVFVICLLPYYIVILIDCFTSLPDWVILASYLNVCANSLVNPFMYAFMCRKFRHRFELMRKCRRRAN